MNEGNTNIGNGILAVGNLLVSISDIEQVLSLIITCVILLVVIVTNVPKVIRIFKDGKVTEDEKEELKQIVEDVKNEVLNVEDEVKKLTGDEDERK